MSQLLLPQEVAPQFTSVMCGLLFTNDPRVSDKSFATALEVIAHRGPDASGWLKFGDSRLGLNRLKVIDLDSRSDQPFLSADGNFALIFNGEVYNYRELARQHQLSLRTTSDTEVVVELFARFGARCVSWFDGMFALVILDTRTHEIFVARDRLGVKPLYISRHGSTMTAASEIAPLLELSGDRELDAVGVRQYRKLRTFFNGRTVYKGVEMFPAGHYLKSGSLHRYWSLPEQSQEPPSDEELRASILASVQQRLIADVPVGAYLSGGLDSTIVAALAGVTHTWTVGFEECNEFAWARMAADRIGSEHHEVLMTSDEFVRLATDMIVRRRDPLSVPNEVLLYKMTREAKAFNTVILSGEGADELFFGYDRVFRWAASAEVWDLEVFSGLYSYGSHNDLEIVEDAVQPFMHRARPLDIVADFFQVAHLHGLLKRLDHSSMLGSVEARVPFVDCGRLVDRMAGVSFEYRMRNDEVKSPLKRIFRDLVPAPIITRDKVGFPVPLEALPLRTTPTQSPMDGWLEFNLRVLSES